MQSLRQAWNGSLARFICERQLRKAADLEFCAEMGISMNLRFEEDTKRERRIQFLKEAVWFAIAAGVVVLLAWLMVEFTLKKVSVIGSAMETTLYNGEDVIVNKFSYLLLSPGRGAVIAFYPEGDDDEPQEWTDSSIVIRRVVGLPGEKIRIADGKIYVNGETITEDYAFGEMISAGRANEEVKLEDDEYFVLSDKRSDLDDSRDTTFTRVRKKNIIGKVILSLNPFSMIGGPEKDTSETAKK